MSSYPPDLSVKKKSRVKRDQNQGVDINRLVASQNPRINPPPQSYQDRTGMPANRIEAFNRMQFVLGQMPPALRGFSIHDLSQATPAAIQALLGEKPTQSSDADKNPAQGQPAAPTPVPTPEATPA